MAGHVDQRHPTPGGELELCVAELDRESASLLLRQSVGFDPGQRSHERGLAVIDVAGRADGERKVRSAGQGRARETHSARQLDVLSRQRTSTHHDRAAVYARYQRRIPGAQRGRERIGARGPRVQTHGRTVELVARQRAAAHGRGHLDHSPARELGEPSRLLARAAPRSAVEHRESRDPAVRHRQSSQWSSSVASSAARQSLSILSARARGGCGKLRRSGSAPTRMPACGPPSSLSPEKQASATPGRDRIGRRRLA